MTEILLVDDDLAFTQVLSRALQKRGFNTHVAHNVADALALSENCHFDSAIVDLKMDGPSGLQLIPALKQQHADIDIVMLTGYSSVVTAVEALKLGAVNYLCKPANADEILAAFSQTVGNPETPIAESRPSVDRVEWEHIQKVLNEYDGNVSATARALGMHRRTLQRKLSKRPVKQ